MTTVELHPAFVWDCDDCGRENILRPIHPECEPPEEIAEALDDMDVPEGHMGYLLKLPDVVVCTHCGAEFESEGS